jgi:hypothetical protein
MPLRNILVALAILIAAAGVERARAAEEWAGITVERGAGGAALPTRSLPPQGLYEGCSPGAELDACVGRLETIRAGGFRYVLNYSAWYGSPAAVLRYADAAAALGLQLIWPLNHPAWRGLESLGATYTTLLAEPVLAESAAATPDLAERSEPDRAVIATAIRLVAQHPATWGFYVGDELPPREAGRVAALSATVRALAPGKPQLYVSRPGAAHLRPFARIVDVAGVDTYPIGSGDPPVARVARTTEAVTAEAKTDTAMVLQAFSWSQYRPYSGRSSYPSLRALEAMRNAALRHAHPTMILWYSYQDILRSDDPRRRWRDLLHAAFSPIRHPPSSARESQPAPSPPSRTGSGFRVPSAVKGGPIRS